MHDFSTDAAVTAFVEHYRYAVARLNKTTADASRAEWQAIVRQLRDEWRQRQGEDSLHEVAFGKPGDGVNSCEADAPWLS